MKFSLHHFIAITAAIVLLQVYTFPAFSQSQFLLLSRTPTSGSFTLAEAGKVPQIITDSNDATVVGIAAAALGNDIKLITGTRPVIEHTLPAATGALANNPLVIIGTLGKSAFIDQLAAKGMIPATTIKGQWERFCITVIPHPDNIRQKLLVIAGSDPRGTAYGVFELSKRIGISPWVWWADVLPQQRTTLYLSGERVISEPPSVQYRGIFINDEDWGLQPWAAKTFEPETGDIGPKTYAKVFELLLRLKANLIWPAMHPSTKPFFHYPGNKKVAEDYAIIIGSSHAEPMLRNNVGEWDRNRMGDFNYLTNKDRIYQYWEERVRASSTINAIYSLGMRGVHDSGMEGVKNAKEAVPLIENIFNDQRGLLGKYINKDVTKVPQAFTAYKEVLDIYDNGLKVPDDVTLVWPDDNYGYIQRLNDEKEQLRSGGSGVYYHASYWGRPHDYLWLGTTHPGLMREEMMKAWDTKANKLWVLNVGDIKPLEYQIQFFLDMAYGAIPFKDSRYTKQHLLQWTSDIFGLQKGKAIQPILWQHYQLAFERRPEFMGWSQTEPTTKTNFTAYNHFYYGDEAQRRINACDSLAEAVRSLQVTISPSQVNAFYELVYYPVVSAGLMNRKFLYRDKSHLYALQNRLSASDYAKQSQDAYNMIIEETTWYNNTLAAGKWKDMMSMVPRNLPVFQEPEISSMIIDSSTIWSIAPEGIDSLQMASGQPLHVPAFDNLNKQQYFIDIFLTRAQTVKWTATTSANWLTLSASGGTLSNLPGKKEQRIWVNIDWRKAPANKKFTGQIHITGAGKQLSVHIAGSHLPPGLAKYKGYIENNGMVSIFATGYSSNSSSPAMQWKVLDDLGHTGHSLQSVPLLSTTQAATIDSIGINKQAIRKKNACLFYDFYSFSAAVPTISVFTLPTHPLNKKHSMRYALCIDDGPLQIIDFRTTGRNETWKQNVLSNRAEQKITLPFLHAGKHVLKIYAIDPGVVLDRILIGLVGTKKAYSVIPETKISF